MKEEKKNDYPKIEVKANDKMTYEINLTLPTKEAAQIVCNSLDVDSEFIEEIKREIKTEGRVLTIKYDLDAYLIKNLKKSLSSLFENMKLVVQTIKDFSPSK